MKSVLISIQPYYVFLIIAHLMGWDIPQKKTVEVRKDFPKDQAWDRRLHIYCSKNRRSFNRIPKQYQPFMKKLLGKVVGEFLCDRIEEDDLYYTVECDEFWRKTTCLTQKELIQYGDYNTLYFWHISDLKIYDKPKELGEFMIKVKSSDKRCLGNGVKDYWQAQGYDDREETHCLVRLTRPPQSWCYVEE